MRTGSEGGHRQCSRDLASRCRRHLRDIRVSARLSAFGVQQRTGILALAVDVVDLRVMAGVRQRRVQNVVEIRRQDVQKAFVARGGDLAAEMQWSA